MVCDIKLFNDDVFIFFSMDWILFLFGLIWWWMKVFFCFNWVSEIEVLDIIVLSICNGLGGFNLGFSVFLG